MKYTLFSFALLITLHTTYIESNKELLPPVPKKMSLEKQAEILKLEIASKNYQWLNEEVHCGPCSITRNTISNLLCVTTDGSANLLIRDS